MISRSAAPRSTSRTGAARLLGKLLRYVFPDHWTFLLGEIALYCFIVLVADRHLPDASSSIPSQRHHLPRLATRRCAAAGCRDAYGSALASVAWTCKRRPAHAPDPPLGGAGVRRRDPGAHDADLLHRRLPQAPRAQLRDRPDAARCSPSSRASPATRCPTTCSRGMGLAIAYAVALSIPVVGGHAGARGLGRRRSRGLRRSSRASTSSTC